LRVLPRKDAELERDTLGREVIGREMTGRDPKYLLEDQAYAIQQRKIL
jgi:hypothetical protein